MSIRKPILLFITLFFILSQSLFALSNLTKEEESDVIEKLATYSLVNAAIESVLDAHMNAEPDSVFPNSDAMATLMEFQSFADPLLDNVPNQESINMTNINTVFDKIEQVKTDNSDTYTYYKALQDVMDTAGAPVALLSLGTNLYDFFVLNPPNLFSYDYDEQLIHYDAEVLANMGLNSYGAYVSTAKIAASIVKYMPPGVASSVVSKAAFWSENFIAKVVLDGKWVSGLGAATIAAQIVGLVYVGIRDDVIEEIEENILLQYKTYISNRQLILKKLVKVYEEKEQEGSDIELQDITDILEKYSIQANYSHFAPMLYRLDTIFTEYYLKTDFSTLNNTQKIHIALDALVKLSMIEDAELEAYIMDVVGTKAGDQIFGAILGSSSFGALNTTEFLEKIFVYYGAANANGRTYHSYDYYNLIFKVAFNSEAARILQNKLVELGREIERMKKAQRVHEEREEAVSKLLPIATGTLGDSIAVHFGKSVEYRDEILEASTLGKPYKFSYQAEGEGFLSVEATYDASVSALVLTSPSDKAYNLYRVWIPQAPRWDGDTEERFYTYTLPVSNTGVWAENLSDDGLGGGGESNATSPVLKTGQTTSYAEFDDGHYQAGVMRDYTRSNAGVVTDNVTKLEWQDDVDPVSKPWLTQANYDADNYNDTSGDTATTYCSELTLDGGGWRLPSIEELETIIDYGQASPSVTENIFQNISSSDYWSSTTYARDTSNAWDVYFKNAYSFHNNKTSSSYVRCVRGGQFESSSFNRNDETEVVTDSTTRLQWQDNAIDATTYLTWIDAIDYCENTLSLGGYNDWRLPNKKELLSITDRLRYDPAIGDAVFVNRASSYYWSSTAPYGNTSYAWSVNFKYGSSSYYDKTADTFVRCVRGGQFETLIMPKVAFISEIPQDYSIQHQSFTKIWTLGRDLTDYSVEILSSSYASHTAALIDGDTISIELTPDSSNPLNTIILKLKDPEGASVLIGNSETFWATVRTGYAPRLADGQSKQMTGVIGETVSMDIKTYDGDGDSVSLSVKNDDGGSVSISGNTLSASFGDSEIFHTITITLDDGKESVDVDIVVFRFDSSTIETFYSDVDPNNHNHHFPDIAAATLAGVVSGQTDPNSPTQRIFRPEDNASMAEVLAMVIGAAKEAGLIELESAEYYLDAYPSWSIPYYTFARELGAVSDLGGDLSVLYPTREEVVQIIVKVLGLDEKLATFPKIYATYNDEDDFSNDAMIRYAKETRVFGLFMTSDSALPQWKVSRAEMASIITRIMMIPKADVTVTPEEIEYGDVISIDLENIRASKVSTDYTWIESAGDVSSKFAMNLHLIDTPEAYDSSWMLTKLPNQLVSMINNNGIYNIIVQDINVSFSDVDGDGISDRYDDNNTDGPLADNDGDGEVNYLDLDDDNDGMSDEYEIRYGLNPFNDSDANEDADGDGATNLEECRGGSDPSDKDDVPSGSSITPVIMYLLF